MIAAMEIMIVGYGRMGREVERIAVKRGHTIALKVDPVDPEADAVDVTKIAIPTCDAVIEFSLPACVLENAKYYAAHSLSAVLGTTGWGSSEQLDPIYRGGGACLWGSNFSVGAHLFFRLVEQASELCRDLDEYDMLMYEIHHRRKQDSPSGTALSTAEKILASGKKRTIVTERLDRKPEEGELHVASLRGGEVPGIHTVMLDSEADTVEIKHTVRNRSGLALGSVLGAEWIVSKRGVFGVDEFMTDLLQGGIEE